MSQIRATRGRPKGTGLDDHDQLISVARMMARDPSLKPTTAIRSAGITDPSSIRRLRDKFNDVRDKLMAEVAGAGEHAAQPSLAASPPSSPRRAAAALSSPSAPRKSSAAQKSAVSLGQDAPSTNIAVAEMAPTASPDASRSTQPSPLVLASPPGWMMIWCGIGLQSINTAVALQISFVENMLRMPHMASALRGQVALNEFALAFGPRPDGLDHRSGETLH